MQVSQKGLRQTDIPRVALTSFALLLSILSLTEGRDLPRSAKGDLHHVARAFTVEDFPAEYVILSQVGHSVAACFLVPDLLNFCEQGSSAGAILDLHLIDVA